VDDIDNHFQVQSIQCFSKTERNNSYTSWARNAGVKHHGQ